jgi:hypothetical protein
MGGNFRLTLLAISLFCLGFGSFFVMEAAYGRTSFESITWQRTVAVAPTPSNCGGNAIHCAPDFDDTVARIYEPEADFVSEPPIPRLNPRHSKVALSVRSGNPLKRIPKPRRQPADNVLEIADFAAVSVDELSDETVGYRAGPLSAVDSEETRRMSESNTALGNKTGDAVMGVGRADDATATAFQNLWQAVIAGGGTANNSTTDLGPIGP